MNVIDLVAYAQMKQAEQLAQEGERKAESRRQVNLEWVLADLLADIQAA